MLQLDLYTPKIMSKNKETFLIKRSWSNHFCEPDKILSGAQLTNSLNLKHLSASQVKRTDTKVRQNNLKKQREKICKRSTDTALNLKDSIFSWGNVLTLLHWTEL